MPNDDETKRRLTAIEAQLSQVVRQAVHAVNSEDRIKEAVAQLLTDVRQDTYRAVMSVHRYMQEVDDRRSAGQKQAKVFRYLILSGVCIIIVILLWQR